MNLLHEDGQTKTKGTEVLADDIRPVVDAVCNELGIAARERRRRAAVEERILVAWRRGPRQPLDLVRAGLEG
ncbi:hypothetical protein [Aquibium microcysteis]|uniref:hypothetical protein n=1 Tax=Aquibium microcysteis TaxID=675281 RepID=UPI00165CF747|nr:hypothetical protein [Aquibium microcysteis]